MKSLVIYYSLTGTTHKLATAIADHLSADIEELRCSRYSANSWGYIRAGFDSWTGNLPPVQPLVHVAARYELIIVAGPIWVSHPATPVRTFLKQERSRLPRVAFVLTHRGGWEGQSLRELEEAAGRVPVATLVVHEKDVKEERFSAALLSFEVELRRPEAA